MEMPKKKKIVLPKSHFIYFIITTLTIHPRLQKNLQFTFIKIILYFLHTNKKENHVIVLFGDTVEGE